MRRLHAPAAKPLLAAVALCLLATCLWAASQWRNAEPPPAPARADLVQLVRPAAGARAARRRGARHATFLIYSWNYAMFNQTLRNLLDEGFGGLVVLDNSPGRDAARDRFLAASGVEVVATRTPLAFAQLQNALRALAADRALDFYFWGHADIVLVGPARARPPVSDLF